MKKNNLIKNEETALYYLRVFSETTREPFLILDSNLRILGASDPFYEKFMVSEEQTVNKFIYDLGNKQWDISSLRKMLEKILPKDKIFYDYEVVHNFPKIGRKTMLLNARQLDATNHILLSIEDITLKKQIEKKLADYTKKLKNDVAIKTEELNARIDELENLNKIMVGRELKMVEQKKEIARLKKK